MPSSLRPAACPNSTHLLGLSWLALVALALGCQRASTAAVPAEQPKDAAMKNKPTAAELQAKLTAEQYRCTQQSGTEQPFANAYWDNHAAGLYVDVVDGRPLFLSSTKYDSHSGWPSFTDAIAGSIVEHADHSHNMVRREVRSQGADSHLGHVFDDGPGPSHQRYCINSASLRFIPASSLKHAGYGQFLFALANDIGAEVLTVAAGCFWGVEELFAEQPGVLATQAGYTGGAAKQTTYEEVCSGSTGHAEAVQVLFDPKETSYETLLAFFFRMHDPTTPNRQKNDRGTQYRSAIFVANQAQEKSARRLLAKAQASKHFAAPIVTEVSKLTHFIRAEPYHQQYLDKHPNGYRCHAVAPWTLSP